MIYRESTPSFECSGIVERFWSVEYDAGSEAPPEPVLPDGCPEIVFNLADRFQRIPTYGDVETQASAIVSGQIRSRLLIRPTGRVSLFGVRFRPNAAMGFLGVAMSSLTDQVVPLSDVIGGLSGELESRIGETANFEERVAIVESALGSRRSNGDASIVAGLTEMITESGGRMSVMELVDRSGVGERRIERMFDKYVGVSPKVFSRIVRFRSVVRSIEAADSFGLLDTALSFGYFDQSHMIHEFNEFAGTSPRGYFEQTHRLSELFTS
ncbi:MAG: helix-turn-helix domain-containing protein [Pyrinomonadaceae bacterium]